MFLVKLFILYIYIYFASLGEKETFKSQIRILSSSSWNLDIEYSSHLIKGENLSLTFKISFFIWRGRNNIILKIYINNLLF